MTNLRWIPMSLLAMVLVLAVACGGDDDDNDSSTGATGANTPAASSSGSTGGSQATGGSQSSTGGTVNGGDVAASLADVDSFRFTMSMKLDADAPAGATGDAASAAALLALFGNIQMEGAYVAPDRVMTKASFFGTEIQQIQIGGQSWTNDGTGWVADTDPSSAGSSIPFDVSNPADMFEMIPNDQLAGAETSKEKVNGQNTIRYHFDKEALQALAESTGDGSDLGDLSEVDTLDLDLWLTEDGNLPVKMLMYMEGESEGVGITAQVELNVTDVNDASIKIEPPL